MLKELIELFSSKKAVHSPVKSSSSKTHLKIETIYSKETSLKKNKQAKTTSPKDLLISQKNYLMRVNPSTFASIDIVTLNNDTLLVGPTKHSPILDGIFMYPYHVIYENEWPDIQKQAASKNAGIATFKPTRAIECLKLTHNQDGKSISYLVDYHAISRVKWLWHSSTLSASDTVESNG